jgi:hypothetical protein
MHGFSPDSRVRRLLETTKYTARPAATTKGTTKTSKIFLLILQPDDQLLTAYETTYAGFFEVFEVFVVQ